MEGVLSRFKSYNDDQYKPLADDAILAWKQPDGANPCSDLILALADLK